MVTIKGKGYNPLFKKQLLFRYFSSIKIGLGQLSNVMENITSDDLIGIFVFACNDAKIEDITVNDVYDEIDERDEVFGELADWLGGELNDDGKKKGRGLKT